MLAGRDEPARLLGRRLHERVARHAHRLADCDRRDAMAVEPGAAVGEVVGREKEIAVGLLNREQKLEAAADGVAVAAVEVIVPCAQKTQ